MLTAILIAFITGGVCGVLLLTTLMHNGNLSEKEQQDYGLGDEAGRLHDQQQELPFFCKHQAD